MVWVGKEGKKGKEEKNEIFPDLASLQSQPTHAFALATQEFGGRLFQKAI